VEQQLCDFWFLKNLMHELCFSKILSIYPIFVDLKTYRKNILLVGRKNQGQLKKSLQAIRFFSG
jgi:hypothetical protein